MPVNPFNILLGISARCFCLDEEEPKSDYGDCLGGTSCCADGVWFDDFVKMLIATKFSPIWITNCGEKVPNVFINYVTGNFLMKRFR